MRVSTCFNAHLSCDGSHDAHDTGGNHKYSGATLHRGWLTLKGVRPSRIIFRHALPNALAPIVNVVALNLAYLITGVVIVEIVFVFPGLGQLMVDGVRFRDVPVVQASSLVFASAYVGLNLLADIISTATNPRLMRRK